MGKTFNILPTFQHDSYYGARVKGDFVVPRTSRRIGDGTFSVVAAQTYNRT